MKVEVNIDTDDDIDVKEIRINFKPLLSDDGQTSDKTKKVTEKQKPTETWSKLKTCFSKLLKFCFIIILVIVIILCILYGEFIIVVY